MRRPPAASARGEEPLVVDVEKIVAGGFGLARADGRVVLVEDAAPGDRLEVSLVEEHPGWARARILRIVEPGPDRREAPCRHAAACGGCTLQHLLYAGQIRAKEGVLRESLQRIGKLEAPATIPVHVGAEWRYRRRARLHARRTRAGEIVLGFRGRDGRTVVDLEACPVLRERLEAALGPLRDELAREARPPAEIALMECEEGVARAGDGSTCHVRVGEFLLETTPGAFFQSNALLVERLAARVVELAAEGVDRRQAADLYAGSGLFALPLARIFERVVAVEGSARSAELLARNRAAAGLGNLRTLGAPVDGAFDARVGECLEGAVVVLDPPREGLDGSVREALLRSRAARVVYVSCDPASLARDLGHLARGGFRLGALEVFDLFPQTHHVETVARLDAAPLL